MLTLADLPPAFRERFDLPRPRGAQLLSWTLHHGMRQVMTRLPDRLRYRTPPTGTQPAAAPAESSSPASPVGVPRQRRPRRGDTRQKRLDMFFRQVLDQTGDGYVDAADLQAMAHDICWQLELTPEREKEVYAAFDAWWQHIRSTMDTDHDDRVDRAEFAAAMLAGIDRDPDFLDKGLRVAVRTLFRAADTDSSGHLGPDEYRTIFGGSRVHPAELNHGFRQLDADGDGQIAEEEFVGIHRLLHRPYRHHRGCPTTRTAKASLTP
jgi:Ca2+-binding EF-hand superfamily protein